MGSGTGGASDERWGGNINDVTGKAVRSLTAKILRRLEIVGKPIARNRREGERRALPRPPAQGGGDEGSRRSGTCEP